MQLSILTPTYRSNAVACARIAQVCSWASPEIEVIVRDNSGDPKKRALIAQFQRDNCKIISVDPCPGPENFAAALKMATGEFIFYVADDDLCFDRAVAALPALIDVAAKNSDIVGVTGTYAIETARGTSLGSYNGIDSDDVETRVAGYLGYGANVLVYSPMRRALYERIFALMRSMPLFFSFHDQVMCLLFILAGKFVTIPRMMYSYDIGPWETDEGSQKQDVGFYTEAGVDPAINKLHWFLCGFEGAVLARNSGVIPNYPWTQRQRIADQWFAVMFGRFLRSARMTFDSPYTAPAEALCQKLRASQGRLSFDGMLADIADLMAMFAPDLAQRYFQFWSAELNRRQPAAAIA